MVASVLLVLVLAAAAPVEPAAALHRGALHGQLEVVRAELERGTPVGLRGEHEWTALHWAAIGDQPEAAALLLERGAEPDARGQFDLTPLHWAALRGSSRVAETLVKRGARLESRSVFGTTPLHEAGNERVVEVLATAGAKLDQRDEEGFTPLFLARSKEVGQALLQRGADLHARAKDGRSLFDMMVVNTMLPSGLVVYVRRSAARLRLDDTTVRLQLRNVGPAPLERLAVTAESEAVTVTPGPAVARVEPGQQARLELTLRRRPEVVEGVYPLVAVLSAGGRRLGTVELELANSREELPSDLGLVPVGRTTLRETPSKWYYLAFLAVPVLVLAGYLLRRRSVGPRA